MAFGDVYELIDVQTLAGQEILNVYFYLQNNVAVAPSAIDMIESYEGQVLPTLASAQVDDVLHTELRCRNLFDDSDRATKSISVAGTNGGTDYQSNFDAVGFSLVQDNGAVKNGAKRIAGAPQDFSTDGVIDSTGAIALLTTIGGLLSGTLDYGILATWLPVIVKRILVSPGNYRLPVNSGEAILGAVTDAIFNPVLTSQVSRKIGVGI